MKKIITSLLFLCIVLINLIAQQNPSDWISEESVASVVKLSSLLTIYTVENLPDNYSYKTKDGKPDFEQGIITKKEQRLVSVGTGVIVTENGMIMTNAHVTNAYDVPEISIKHNPAGKTMYGINDVSIKTVVVNSDSSFMYVGICTTEELKKNHDCQKLSYIAEFLTGDIDIKNGYRDRALLHIVKTCSLGEDGLPVEGDDCLNKVKLPYVKLSNPFDHSYLDTKVRAVGFPGVGDPNRSSKTSGEILGYENEQVSNILHTSWISNGNSGGGLFYKDNLIGINTWDNQTNASRPVAIAQPNTFWDELFAYCKYFYDFIKTPDYDYNWINQDPSSDSYKDDVYMEIQIVERQNVNNPLKNGYLIIYDSKYSQDFISNYISCEKEFENSWEVVKLLWKYDLDDVVSAVGIDKELALKFKNLTRLEEMRDLFVDDIVPYYDLWCKGEFVYKIFNVDSSGKTFVVIPQNTKFKLVYETPEGNDSDTFTFRTTTEKEQGTYTLKIDRF